MKRLYARLTPMNKQKNCLFFSIGIQTLVLWRSRWARYQLCYAASFPALGNCQPISEFRVKWCKNSGVILCLHKKMNLIPVKSQESTLPL
jgi:hypothetical protein